MKDWKMYLVYVGVIAAGVALALYVYEKFMDNKVQGDIKKSTDAVAVNSPVAQNAMADTYN